MLDRFSISRFSIGYQPMFALFVADGILRVAKQRERIAAGIAAALIIAFAAYTVPALTTVRNEIAPSVVGARSIVEHVDPRHERLFVGHTMTQFVDLLTPGFPYTRVIDEHALPLTAENRPAWLLVERMQTGESGFVFRRERGVLWNIARRHYFDVKLQPLDDRPRFVSGWYAPESMGKDEWRWMGGRAVLLLPPSHGRTVLRMQLGIPAEVMPKNPAITVKLNGRVVEEFHTTDGAVDRNYRVVPAPGELPNVLELSIDRTVTPKDDGRQLGMRLRDLAWGPV